MKRLQFLFGLVILASAVTLGSIILFKPRERGADGWAMRGGALDGDDAPPFDWSGPANLRASRATKGAGIGRVVPEVPGDPELILQARHVEAAARKRLLAMSAELELTREQEAKIFPLLARSTPSFDESLAVVDGSGRRTGGPLTPRAADEGIHNLLNPRQQEELIESIAEEDLWWADVIARLERDLHRSTDPIEEPIPADEPDPGPLAPAPHQGRNLFQLQRESSR